MCVSGSETLRSRLLSVTRRGGTPHFPISIDLLSSRSQGAKDRREEVVRFKRDCMRH